MGTERPSDWLHKAASSPGTVRFKSPKRNLPNPGDRIEVHCLSNNVLEFNSSEAMPFSVIHTLRSAKGMLSVDDVANLLGLSRFTIYRMAQRRQIPCLLIAGSRRFDPASLTAWLIRKEPQLEAGFRFVQKAA
jgi:excisionase family DNA binding protein